MKPSRLASLALLAFASALAASPALTVYNQGFAVVRDTVPLDLKAGVNLVNFGGVTAEMEPDSVVLRDPVGKHAVGILEQSYRAETLSKGMLLSLNEGKTITFLVSDQDGREHPVKGRIIRSGYVPGGDKDEDPIIEVDGQLRFSLPGEPVFPSLADDAVLKPTLTWQLNSEKPQKFDVELGYVSGGFSWEATYNFVTPEKGDTMEVTGWVTVENSSGADFRDATIKLLAGEVSKVQRAGGKHEVQKIMESAAADPFAAPEVTEKAFDEFHLYSLPRPVTLRNRETKQVEFIRASGVKSEVIYVYDGSGFGSGFAFGGEPVRDQEYGISGHKKISVFREFKNSKENKLGLPLPAGKIRFYREDSADKRVEFTGENNITHTPQGELVRLHTGEAFDLVGERKQTDFRLATREDRAEESFEIRLRNRKKDTVEIRVVEHLYRGVNWTILEKSQDFSKTDAGTVEFRVSVAPDEEKVVTYKVRYDWK